MYKCQFCELSGVHEQGRDCPAFGEKYHECQISNHFSLLCKSRNNRSHQLRKQKSGKREKKTKKTKEYSESTSSEDEFFSHAAERLSQAKKIREISRDDGNYQTVPVRLDDFFVVMEADSGADVKIMDEHQFKAFIHRMNDKSTLTNSTVKLRTLQHKIEVEGELQKLKSFVIRHEGKLLNLSWHLEDYIHSH